VPVEDDMKNVGQYGSKSDRRGRTPFALSDLQPDLGSPSQARLGPGPALAESCLFAEPQARGPSPTGTEPEPYSLNLGLSDNSLLSELEFKEQKISLEKKMLSPKAKWRR
jgi:hypothetical protein